MLFHAIIPKYYDSDILQLLVKANVDPNSRAKVFARVEKYVNAMLILAGPAKRTYSNILGCAADYLSQFHDKCTGDIMRQLVSLGYDWSKHTRPDGWTVLHTATRCSNESVLRALILAGGDLNASTQKVL